MAGVLLCGGAFSSTIAASATSYSVLGNCTFGQGGLASENLGQVTWRTAGVASNLYTRVTANDRAASTVRFRINGGDGNQVLSITGSTTGEFEDAVNTDAVAAGDEICTANVTGAGGTTLVANMLAVVFSATTDSMAKFVAGTGENDVTNGATKYWPLAGAGAHATTEALSQFSMRSAGVLKNFWVNVRTNTRSNTCTARSRVNGANGAMAISIGAGVTGILEDTSNTDTLASGDEVNYAIVFGADAGTLRFWTMASELVSTTGTVPIMVARSSGMAYTQGTTGYLYTGGLLTTAVATELDVRQEANRAFVASNMQCYASANSSSATSTLRLRKNGANGTPVISISAGVTGFHEDASNTESFAATDESNYSLAVGAGGTSLTLSLIGMTANFTVASILRQMMQHHA